MNHALTARLLCFAGLATALTWLTQGTILFTRYGFDTDLLTSYLFYLILGGISLSLGMVAWNTVAVKAKQSPFAKVLFIFTLAFVLLRLYNISDGIWEHAEYYLEMGVLSWFVNLIFPLMWAVAFLLIAVHFVSNKPLFKTGTAILIGFAMLTFLFNELSNLVIFSTRFSNDLINNEAETIYVRIPQLLFNAGFAVLTGLFVLGKTLPKTTQQPEDIGDDSDLLDTIEAAPSVNAVATYPGVGWWMYHFLPTLVPVFNLITLAIWGFQKEEAIRSRWATARFCGITVQIGALLLTIRLLNIAEVLPENIGWILTLAFIVCLTLSILLLTLRRTAVSENEPALVEWIGNFVILAIPVIGLIMLIVWASDEQKPLIRKWAQARLLWVISGLLYFIYYYETAEYVQRILQEIVRFQF